jgi:hypothetical protein
LNRDPEQPIDHRAAGLAMLGCVLFCAATGMGIGVFMRSPVIGALIGGAAGIGVGVWLVPGLLRELRR